MAKGLLPLAPPDGDAGVTDPQAVVEAFLAALAAGDTVAADSLVDDDIEYVNVGLPTVRGRKEMAKVFALLDRPGAGFEVYLHAISSDGPVVLTERTDVLVIGRLRAQFWVWGRFEVRDGTITLWRDSFDYVDILRGTLRGLVGVAFPRVNPTPPQGPEAVPGR
ncbi:MAG: limonene-1,2-epoxide hydrolase family protein [Microthrixaceae bacterium]